MSESMPGAVFPSRNSTEIYRLALAAAQSGQTEIRGTHDPIYQAVLSVLLNPQLNTDELDAAELLKSEFEARAQDLVEQAAVMAQDYPSDLVVGENGTPLSVFSFGIVGAARYPVVIEISQAGMTREQNHSIEEAVMGAFFSVNGTVRVAQQFSTEFMAMPADMRPYAQRLACCAMSRTYLDVHWHETGLGAGETDIFFGEPEKRKKGMLFADWLLPIVFVVTPGDVGRTLQLVDELEGSDVMKRCARETLRVLKQAFPSSIYTPEFKILNRFRAFSGLVNLGADDDVWSERDLFG